MKIEKIYLIILKIFIIFFFFKNLIIYDIKKIKIGLCLIAKQENKYIKEYVDYYLKLGFHKIILYDNNNINGENFDDILKKYINKNFVEIINYRGLDKPQKIAYFHCYNTNKNNFDWIAFYDVDEFLFLGNYKNARLFFSLSKFKNCSSILLNWKYYGDNNNIFYEPKPIIERFKIPFEFPKNGKKDIILRTAGKSIIRGGLNITWAHFPHFIKNQPICRPDGTIIKNPFSEPQYSIAYIKHYTTKSTEEFADRLIRGTVYSKNTSNAEYMIQRLKIYYFLFNKINEKKLEVLETKLKINLKKYFINESQKLIN